MSSEITGIHQIAVVCADVSKALPFYRDVMGIPLLFEAGPDLAFLDCGGVRLMLTKPSSEEVAGCSSIIYYRVASVRKAFDAIARRGATVEHEPRVVAPLGDRDVWSAFFKDPGGNLVAIMSEELREG